MARFLSPEEPTSEIINDDNDNKNAFKFPDVPEVYKKPLHYTKSNPAFRTLGVEEFEVDGRRSRSASAPLSMQALSVAHELRKASDIFTHQKRRPEPRKRRSTVGSYVWSSVRREIENFQEHKEHLGPDFDGTPV